MWVYVQATGEIRRNDSLPLGFGYSGAGVGKNNPTAQDIPNVGPIPVGSYAISTPIDSPTHGPLALPLTPFGYNLMFGRCSFLIHGDSIENPGNASEGCIIQSRAVREAITTSGDNVLQVVAS